MNILYLHESWSTNEDGVFIKYDDNNLPFRIFPNCWSSVTRRRRNTQHFRSCELNKESFNNTPSPYDTCYLHEPHTIGEEPHFVIFVLSRHAAMAEREFIRTTWANNSHYSDVGIKRPFVFFVCGMEPHSDCVNNSLHNEVLIKKDILVINMVDSYDNLTLKSILAMRWIETRLGDSVKYVIKTDDDVMLNTFRWMSVLNSNFFRYVWQRPEVKREGKYIVRKEKYRGR